MAHILPYYDYLDILTPEVLKKRGWYKSKAARGIGAERSILKPNTVQQKKESNDGIQTYLQMNVAII